MFDWFFRARDWYLSQPRLNFEAITVGAALLVGFLVMPALIYVAGSLTLESYDGGFFSLYYGFFKGLFVPHLTFWWVVLGPLVFLTLLRLFKLILANIRKS